MELKIPHRGITKTSSTYLPTLDAKFRSVTRDTGQLSKVLPPQLNDIDIQRHRRPYMSVMEQI